MVRFAEPLLDTFGVPHARLEGPDDVQLIPEYYRMSRAAARAGGRAGRAATRAAMCMSPLGPMKPEEVLKVIAAARGNAICVPTMTTSPGVARDRPRRSVGRLRRLHGWGLGDGPGAGPGLSRAPGDRVRRRRLAADAARLAGHHRRRAARATSSICCSRTASTTPPARRRSPAGSTVDCVTMARGAGYRSAIRRHHAARSSSGAARDVHRRGTDLRRAAHLARR